MAFRWSDEEIGMLKIGKRLFAPGVQVPDELVTPELKERLGDSLVEIEIVREVKKPKKDKPK
jgi:hypothetical protein